MPTLFTSRVDLPLGLVGSSPPGVTSTSVVPGTGTGTGTVTGGTPLDSGAGVSAAGGLGGTAGRIKESIAGGMQRLKADAQAAAEKIYKPTTHTQAQAPEPAQAQIPQLYEKGPMATSAAAGGMAAEPTMETLTDTGAPYQQQTQQHQPTLIEKIKEAF